MHNYLLCPSHTHTLTDPADGTLIPSETIRSFRYDTYHIRRERNRILSAPQGHFHPRPNFEKYQKNSADENNAMMRNARQVRILSVSHSHLNVSKPIIPQSTQSCGLVQFHSGRYLSHSAYFYLYTKIVADSCEWLISYANKYVLLRPLMWMMKPLATAPLEQESEYPG